MKPFALLFCLAFVSSATFAQSCNRSKDNDGDYFQPGEFCDDDLRGRTLPKLDDYPAPKIDAFKPVLPKRHDGWDAEDSAGRMEAIQYAYKSGKNVFAGHYLLVVRGACGNGCHRTCLD